MRHTAPRRRDTLAERVTGLITDRSIGTALAVTVAMLALSACGERSTSASGGACGVSEAASWSWPLPDYFPAPVVPRDNPMSAEKVRAKRATATF